MEAWAQELLTIWKTNRVTFAQAFVDAQVQNEQVPVKYTLDDMLQMTDGFIAMMRESFEGGSNDIREMYMNSVWPGVLAQGVPLASIISQITINAVTAYTETAKYCSEENAARILSWLQKWYGGWNYEIVNVGLAYYAANPPTPAS